MKTAHTAMLSDSGTIAKSPIEITLSIYKAS